MTDLVQIQFKAVALDAVAGVKGRIAVFLDPDGKPDLAGRKINALTRKTLDRITAGPGWAKAKPGQLLDVAYPAGLAAEALLVVKLPRKCTVEEARKAGAAIARHRGDRKSVV